MFSEEPALIAPAVSLNATNLSLSSQNHHDKFNSVSKNIESKCTTNNDSNSLKTFGDLRKSILQFGIDNTILDSGKCLDVNEKTSPPANSGVLPLFERKNTLESMSFKNSIDEEKHDKIRPGLSAKRYLSNWTRSWKPQLYESLTTKGYIKEDNLFEANELTPNIKHRIDDDLSKIPPAYRIQRHWLSMKVSPLRGYRFYRAQTDFLGFSKIHFE